MTTTAGSSPQIDAYLAAVGAALADLAPDERADLLAEVEGSLVESAGDSPIASLGPPEEFAAELRASAGLGEPVAAATGPARVSLRAAVAPIAEHPWIVALARAARELAPAWWLVRGYLIVAAVASVTGAGWSSLHSWLPYLGSARSSVLAIALAIVLSLALGLRTRGARGPLLVAVLALDAVALIALVPVERHVTQDATPFVVPYAVPAAPAAGLLENGRQVLNIYPYSRSGKLLHDVRIYDDQGRPVSLGLGPDQLRRVVLSTAGLPLDNVFPIRYRDPNTGRVAHRDASPVRRVPKIATPPLAP